MSKSLSWYPEWTLRIEILDEDHRALVERLSDLARRYGPEPDVSGDPPADPDLISALEKLDALAREHFRREEEFMRTIDYPGLSDHHNEHALLMADYAALVRDLKDRGIDRLDTETLESFKHWLLGHILGTDRGFAQHYFRICGESPEGG